jgi:hypothetical protein
VSQVVGHLNKFSMAWVLAADIGRAGTLVTGDTIP